MNEEIDGFIKFLRKGSEFKGDTEVELFAARIIFLDLFDAFKEYRKINDNCETQYLYSKIKQMKESFPISALHPHLTIKKSIFLPNDKKNNEDQSKVNTKAGITKKSANSEIPENLNSVRPKKMINNFLKPPSCSSNCERDIFDSSPKVNRKKWNKNRDSVSDLMTDEKQNLIDSENINFIVLDLKDMSCISDMNPKSLRSVFKKLLKNKNIPIIQVRSVDDILKETKEEMIAKIQAKSDLFSDFSDCSVSDGKNYSVFRKREKNIEKLIRENQSREKSPSSEESSEKSPLSEESGAESSLSDESGDDIFSENYENSSGFNRKPPSPEKKETGTNKFVCDDDIDCSGSDESYQSEKNCSDAINCEKIANGLPFD
ncbi:hypothetical protein DMUE_2925 [Dictyocoela muelleri]|nr:hypothetical protein DMUE_2925 [Dictyocoela muelleri]